MQLWQLRFTQHSWNPVPMAVPMAHSVILMVVIGLLLVAVELSVRQIGFRWDPETGGKPRYDSYNVDINRSALLSYSTLLFELSQIPK